jgi:hypothetical protein
MTKQIAARDKANGRYTDSRLDKLCSCGHTLGQHSAEKVGKEQPCHECDCNCFTKKR